MKHILAVFLFFILCSCAIKTVSINGKDNSQVSLGQDPMVYFVADNQLHIPNGQAYKVENPIIDKFSEVAVRPPRTTIFAPYAYEALLDELNQSSLLVHLGDASDVSCPQELDRFFNAMDHYKGPWLFVPGNHDGFYTGNTQYKDNNRDPYEWDSACNGERLDKADAIRKYVKKKGLYNKNIDSDKIVEVKRTDKEFEMKYSYLIRSDNDQAHKSFIIQQVRFKNEKDQYIRIVIIDTSQYEKPPKYRNILFFDNKKVAGITGQILENQKKIAEKWFSESKEQKDLLYIAGHHPLKKHWMSQEGLAWFGGSNWLKEVMDEYNVPGYVSAHTHTGGTRELWEGKKEWNTASLIDWPLGMRAMYFQDGNPAMKEILFDREQAPSKMSCFNSKDRRLEKMDVNIQKGSFSGRNTQYALLVSEINIVLRTFERFFPEEISADDISNTREQVEKSKMRVNEEGTAKKLDDEIALLGNLVGTEIKRLDAMLKDANSSVRSRFNQYAWCQLWQSARDDAIKNWNNNKDVLGMRKKWD